MSPKLLGKGMVIWIAFLREAFHRGRLDELVWVPTESMLCDGQTKWLDTEDALWQMVYDQSVWKPYHISHFECDYVLAREGVISVWRQDESYPLLPRR